MSILSNGRAIGKRRPAPVAKTVELYSSEWRTVVVKFGEGVRPPSKPHYFVPFTAQDQTEVGSLFADYHTNDWDGETDEEFDRRALESAMLDRYTRGHVM